MECTEETARDLLRNRDGLEGAVGRLQAHIDYSDADLATLAAVLAHGIAEGQHFLDGNKRTAFAATMGLLALNGYDLSASEEALAEWIIDLSAGLRVAELADRFRKVHGATEVTANGPEGRRGSGYYRARVCGLQRADC